MMIFQNNQKARTSRVYFRKIIEGSTFIFTQLFWANTKLIVVKAKAQWYFAYLFLSFGSTWNFIASYNK